MGVQRGCILQMHFSRGVVFEAVVMSLAPDSDWRTERSLPLRLQMWPLV